MLYIRDKANWDTVLKGEEEFNIMKVGKDEATHCLALAFTFFIYLVFYYLTSVSSLTFIYLLS